MLGEVAGRPPVEIVLSQEALREREPLPGGRVADWSGEGEWPITLDPIFSGLAWSLIFGLVASTGFTLLVIPIAYRWLRQASVRTCELRGAPSRLRSARRTGKVRRAPAQGKVVQIHRGPAAVSGDFVRR